MSNLQTTTVNFSCLDIRGVDTLSTYSFKETPIKFIPDLPSNKYLVTWDFGDDTVSRRYTPTKYYEYPGVYEVKMMVYDCDNNTLLSNFTKEITVLDFLEHSISLDPNDIVDIKCGECFGPLVVTATSPSYQPKLDIYYSISNSNSPNYWNVDEKYSYLVKNNSLLEKVFNYNTSEFIFSEIDKIVFPENKIFVRIEDGNVVKCLESDSGAFYAGLSSNYSFYIKDDGVGEGVVLKLFFDKINNYYKGEYLNYINNLNVSLSCNVVENTPDHLTITSNGFDGEGNTNENFQIGDIKFYNSKIPFTVKVKDVNNFSIKHYDILPLSSIYFKVKHLGGELTCSDFAISSLNFTIEDYDVGGIFRGFIFFVDRPLPLSGVQIEAYIDLDVYSLSGSSTTFDLYNENYYDLYKYGENFDAVQTLKDLRFQETLLDKEILFDDLFGSFYGEDLDHEDIGVKLYEKIKNFTQNTQDIDTCEIDFIESLGSMVGEENKVGEQYIIPQDIKRLINIFSIDKFKLLGTTNKVNENFDPKGRVSKDIYGKNLGEKLDLSTYTISSNLPIVAYEKFSNEYLLLNTYQPVSAVGTHTYPISSFSEDWGWPLVLPENFTFSDMEKYYIFYNYTYSEPSGILDGIIDTQNPKTRLNDIDFESLDIFKNGGLVDNMFLDIYYSGMGLRDSLLFPSISSENCNSSPWLLFNGYPILFNGNPIFF